MLEDGGNSIRPIEEPVAVESCANTPENPPIIILKNTSCLKKLFLNLVKFVPNTYNFFKACFIISSIVACGFSLTTESQTFSACLRVKPRVSKADNASFLFVLL